MGAADSAFRQYFNEERIAGCPADRLEVFRQVSAEMDRARAKHKPCVDFHHASSVIREEYEEFWDEVKRREQDKAAIRMELIQLIGTAMHTILELCDEPNHKDNANAENQD